MQFASLDHFAQELTKSLQEKGWFVSTCATCGKTFFAKQEGLERCNRNNCALDPYGFLKLPKRKKLVSPFEACRILTEHFEIADFVKRQPLSLTNTSGKTDLVIAGVQMYDHAVHGNGEVGIGEYFVAQPCVRMQFQPLVGTHDAISTAFVNICTEMACGGFVSHLHAVDYWLSALSRFGIHMNDVSLVLRVSDNDWGTGTFPALELFFCYGGLELGDAAYAYIPQRNGGILPISDIGFGLERLCWAVNKTPAYYDLLTPWTMKSPREMLDACRTLSLLSLSGITASNKGAGLQFRRFAKVLSEKYYSVKVLSLISYYFDYWAQFIDPVVEKKTALFNVRAEIDRMINVRIREKFQIQPLMHELTEQYLDRLAYQYNVSVKELMEAVQVCLQ